jgi:hypothetical protein
MDRAQTEVVMLKTPTLVVVAVLIVGGALVNGAVTQRWAVFAPDQAQTDRLHALEVRFQDWQPTVVPMDMPVNERSTATARSYQSASTGQTGIVTIISGIPGSVSTHTPDVCYVGSGYKCLRGPKKETLELPGGAATVYVADFAKKTATKAERVRIRWAWSTDGVWVAPDNPRWQFAKQLNSVPVLYKLYVATPLPEPDGDEKVHEDDPLTKAFVAAAWAQFAAAFGSK